MSKRKPDNVIKSEKNIENKDVREAEQYQIAKRKNLTSSRIFVFCQTDEVIYR